MCSRPGIPKPADRRPVAREARHACRATNPAGVRRRLGGAAARRRRGRSPSLGGKRLRASVTAVADGHALVIGGGGVAGIAWVTGLLAGLAEAGQDVTGGADVIIGTSAGATVAAQLGSGLSLEELFAR